MSTGYTLLNGFTVAGGFVLSIIALMLLIVKQSGSLLLIIAMLLILLGLQGWQYISTLVHLEEIAQELEEIKQTLNQEK